MLRNWLTKKKEQQKEFARADYAGLNAKGKQLLRGIRNNLAKDLNKERNLINRNLAVKIEGKSPVLEEFKDLSNQKRSILQKRARNASNYMKNIYKNDMGLHN